MRRMDEDEERSSGKVKKRVPKGTSAYQAAWIVDSEDEEYSEEEDDDGDMRMEMDDDEVVEPAENSYPPEDDDEQYEEIELENGKDEYKDELDPEEEQRQ